MVDIISPPCKVPFVKADALGNTFEIYDVSAIDLPHDIVQRIVQTITTRPTGPGFDQGLFIDVRHLLPTLRFFNADGSEAESCGNGSRAAGLLWLVSHSADTVTFSTKGGRVTISRIEALPLAEPDMDYTASVQLLMPPPIIALPPQALSAFIQDIPLLYPALHVLAGNPHLVLFPDVSPAELLNYALTHGPAISIAACFPAGINVGFAKRDVQCTNIIDLVVYERGAGFTNACGTGAIAAAAAARKHGMLEKEITVNQVGGVLNIIFDTNAVRQIGKAHIMESGILDITQPIKND